MVLNDPHRWLAETKVIVKPLEILLNKLISNIYNHSVESVFEKAFKWKRKFGNNSDILRLLFQLME